VIENDQTIRVKIVAGDKKAFMKFYRQYQPKLLGYVASRVKSTQDAEEIVQDAFLGFVDSLPVFGGRSSLSTFLVSIAKHEIADYYRKLYAKKVLKHVPFVDQVVVEPMYDVNETREKFDQALAKLKEEEKKLVLWKYEEELSVAEMAKKLGKTIKATESKLYRARQAFKLAYAGSGTNSESS
jgi:RNA polymerase sigma-70 factor, ECF subfamily